MAQAAFLVGGADGDQTAAIGVVGVAGGVLLAYGLSSLTPVGEARLAEPTNGFSFDSSALLVGGLVFLAVFLALGTWPAVTVARTARTGGRYRTQRPSRTVGLLAELGASASTLIGLRRAVQRGGGHSSVPVGSALVGSVLAVTALCATAVFGSSLTHLLTTPSLYGQPLDLYISVNSPGTPAQAEHLVDDIERERTVTGITAGLSGDVSINGHTVAAQGEQPIRGTRLLTTITGRLPDTPDEVAMGARRYGKWGPTSAPWYGCRYPMLAVGRGPRAVGWSESPCSHPTSEPADSAAAPFSTSRGSVPDVRRGPNPGGVPSSRPIAARA